MEDEILGQKNNASHKGGGIRPGQEPLCMFVCLCVRLCVVEDEDRGRKLNAKRHCTWVYNLGLNAMRAFARHSITVNY